MSERESVQSLLTHRKLTRAIAEVARVRMTEYLATLAPLLQPKMVLGDYVRGGSKESTKRADTAFKDFQSTYESLAAAKPFNLPRELSQPLAFAGGASLEITPVDYPLSIQSGSETRTIMVRSPLVWGLSYTGYASSRLPELLKTKLGPGDDLQQLVIGHVLMHAVTTNLPGLMRTFDALHFPITTTTLPEFGSLPLTRIGLAISTIRPSDAVILESAELTGMDAFEEVVNADDLSKLADPLKAQLMTIVGQQAPHLIAG